MKATSKSLSTLIREGVLSMMVLTFLPSLAVDIECVVKDPHSTIDLYPKRDESVFPQSMVKKLGLKAI